jgi:hypothetical protein
MVFLVEERGIRWTDDHHEGVGGLQRTRNTSKAKCSMGCAYGRPKSLWVVPASPPELCPVGSRQHLTTHVQHARPRFLIVGQIVALSARKRDKPIFIKIKRMANRSLTKIASCCWHALNSADEGWTSWHSTALQFQPLQIERSLR